MDQGDENENPSSYYDHGNYFGDSYFNNQVDDISAYAIISSNSEDHHDPILPEDKKLAIDVLFVTQESNTKQLGMLAIAARPNSSQTTSLAVTLADDVLNPLP